MLLSSDGICRAGRAVRTNAKSDGNARKKLPIEPVWDATTLTVEANQK